MHGTDDCGVFGHHNCGGAGEYMDIRYNSFFYTRDNAFKLRGPRAWAWTSCRTCSHTCS